jgi:signal transduction histidine kinase
MLHRLILEDVFEIVICEARELTGATGGSLFLLEEDKWLREAENDITLDPLSRRIPVEGTVTGQAVITRQPVLVNRYTSGNVETRTSSAKTESLLAVPLQVGDVPIGALNVANKEGGFTQEDVRILGLLADVAAIAIENARLREKAKLLAIVEERQRLARELHDSVTQAMYSVTLYAEATHMALEANKMDVVAENLRELKVMAREALFGIRLLIFELHPPILEEQGLASALQVRLSSVESRAGLSTEMVVEKNRRLPLNLEEELYRIALEALNNTVKHARAEHVVVTLQFTESQVHLEVTDDGIGYDPTTAKESGGMGLNGMDERARRLGGHLVIESAMGKGTRLIVEAPI